MSKTEITNKLLKEAIADAEAVRETAVANAKMVLEEQLTPQIKDIIARRLRVEAEMSDEPEKTTEKAKELDASDAEPVSGGGPEDTSNIGSSENTEPSDDSFDSSEIGTEGDEVAEQPEGNGEVWYEDWDEADLDLDTIIKELEEDIAALSTKDEEEPAPAAEEPEPTIEEPKAEEPAPAAEEPKAEEPTPAAEEPKAEEPAPVAEPVTEPSDEDDELDLEEILAELEADEPLEDPKDIMASKLAGIKNELAQYREAVKILRGKLQEVNLLNAKLHYTNKMFRKEGLNSDQKARIIESFDRATTIREVKLLFTALVENFVASKSLVKPRNKVVAEGIASKVIPSAIKKETNQEVIVENAVARRLQELAGII